MRVKRRNATRVTLTYSDVKGDIGRRIENHRCKLSHFCELDVSSKAQYHQFTAVLFIGQIIWSLDVTFFEKKRRVDRLTDREGLCTLIGTSRSFSQEGLFCKKMEAHERHAIFPSTRIFTDKSD